MRKLVLTLVLLMLFTMPAWAGSPVKVNGTTYITETISKDGTTYVPVRFVAEKMGAEVGYDAKSNTVIIEGATGANNQLKRPPIHGDANFVSKINQTLDLLQDRDLMHYYLICDNVKQINIDEAIPLDREGYVTAYCRYDGTVSFTKEFMQDPNHFVPVYIAGVLAHEGTHAMQYKHFPYATANYKEVEAYNNQNLALIQLGAPSWMLEEVKKMNDTYLQ